MINYLICWKEANIQMWEMVKREDDNIFLMNLLKNKEVDNHSIFMIPTSGIIGALWLWRETHKSSRVNFYDFFNDFGIEYQKPPVSEDDKAFIKESNERREYNTKYGWVSPDGKYFSCGYQGHINLADRICFGLADTNNAELYLEEHGWLKISKSLFEDEYNIHMSEKHTISSNQMNTLIRMKLDGAKGVDENLCSE